MKLTLVDNLPFSQVTVAYRGLVVTIDNVLIDTGSATTILAADRVTAVHITPEPQDTLHTIRGVGGTEVVFTRRVDYVQIGEQQVPNLEIEVGGMDYGFEINGILGMDFLRQAGAVINLQDLSLTFVD
ncbi:MAG: retropepsin-like domain-containing protein [Ardenticatenaceae bacterium]|nr:retropepsin-like domain-containing protein [Ardenticatenaceae bacterium]